ncbi:MAG: winged helix-turn-helix domain-containing protein, partial [Ruminococcus flavefaciens]|nr:winged helix-turn-helix domain-containing protein [Ruminococcus flavefaciens]
EGIVEKGGRKIELTKTEFLILELLMQNRGRIFTKQQIFDYVWKDTYVGDDNTIMVHISNLRSKIEDTPKTPAILKTVKGLGYKLEKG